MTEFAELLDKCNPQELSDILSALEGSGLSPKGPAPRASQRGVAPAPPSAQPQQPVPPAQPQMSPPGRRHVSASKKLAESGFGDSGSSQLTLEEVKQLLDQHSANVVSEVQKLLATKTLPSAPVSTALLPVQAQAPMTWASTQPAIGDAIDVNTLTQMLVERDREVQALEAHLAQLQAELTEKDRYVAELGGELDKTLREVRHKQLDLEFQQLKLEERVRSNAELEQTQRVLTARVEEASLKSRHAALDADMSLLTPRGLRAQGSLPWTVRKNRLPAVSSTAIGR